MKIVQASKAISSSWQYKGNHKEQLSNPLVLIFADRKLLQDPEILEDMIIEMKKNKDKKHF